MSGKVPESGDEVNRKREMFMCVRKASRWDAISHKVDNCYFLQWIFTKVQHIGKHTNEKYVVALLENACGRVYSTRRQNRIVPESVSYHSPPSFFRDNGHPEDEFLFFRESAKQNRLLNKINAFLFGLSWSLFCFQNSDILQYLVVRTEVRCCWTGQCVCSTLTDSDSFQSECANLHTQPEGMKGRILYTFPTKQGSFLKKEYSCDFLACTHCSVLI